MGFYVDSGRYGSRPTQIEVPQKSDGFSDAYPYHMITKFSDLPYPYIY